MSVRNASSSIYYGNIDAQNWSLMSVNTSLSPGFVGLFEWVVMTFGLKNAGATYQRAMNLIFHDLFGVTFVTP